MFSGKSTELIRRCSRYESIGKDVVIINHKLDDRCGDSSVQTHSKTTHKAIKCSRLTRLRFAKMPDVIGIDEAQFFKDLYQFVTIMEKQNVVLIIAGLDGDFRRSLFGEIYKCIPLCDSITKLTAMCSACKDGTPGIFTKKLDENNEDVIDVGGCEKFASVCRRHYIG